MNRPMTRYPCCFNNRAETEESTPPDMPTTTVFMGGSIAQSRIENRIRIIYGERGERIGHGHGHAHGHEKRGARCPGGYFVPEPVCVPQPDFLRRASVAAA